MNRFMALLQDGEETSGVLTPLLDLVTKLEMRGVQGARETALNWLMTATVLVVLVVCAMQLIKWRLKVRAIGKGKRWSLPRTFGFALLGGLPALFLLLLMSGYATLDYWTIMGLTGVIWTTVIAWLFYCVSMVGCDLIFPWNRTDYGLR